MLMQMRLPDQGFTLRNIFTSLVSFYLSIYYFNYLTSRLDSLKLAYYFIEEKVLLSFLRNSSIVALPLEMKLGNLFVY